MVLSLALYPYVFLIVSANFKQQMPLYIMSRTLCTQPWKRWRKITLPMAMPAIAGGMILVMMETIADFGAVHFLSVDTLTVGMYRTLYGFHDMGASARLALLLTGVVGVLVLWQYHTQRSHISLPSVCFVHSSQRLSRGRGLVAMGVCALVFGFAFVVPLVPLLGWSYQQWVHDNVAVQWHVISNSLTLSGAATMLILCVIGVLTYLERFRKKTIGYYGTFGYALPGTVVALGVIIVLSMFGRSITHSAAALGYHWDLILTGSFAALLFAYFVRFYALAFQPLQQAYMTLKPEFEWVARSLNSTPLSRIRRLYMPMLKPTFTVAGLLVFVECMKELSATLIIRPFNFETMATATFQMVSDERVQQAAPYALAIVLATSLSVMILIRQLRYNQD